MPFENDLRAALDAAFDTSSLRQLLRYELDLDLEAISGSTDKSILIDSVLQESKRNGWRAQLVRAAYRSRPGNKLLQALMQDPRVYEDGIRHGNVQVVQPATAPPFLDQSHILSVLMDMARMQATLSAIDRRTQRLEDEIHGYVRYGFYALLLIAVCAVIMLFLFAVGGGSVARGAAQADTWIRQGGALAVGAYVYVQAMLINAVRSVLWGGVSGNI